MELKGIKERNLTDKIMESMSEAEPDAELDAKPDDEPDDEPEVIQEPEPIFEHETESIYENPYSTHIYHDFGGSIIPARNFNDDQWTDETIFQKIKKRKWSLFYLTVGLLIGGTIVGISMHFTQVCTTTTSPEKTRLGESQCLTQSAIFPEYSLSVVLYEQLKSL